MTLSTVASPTRQRRSPSALGAALISAALSVAALTTIALLGAAPAIAQQTGPEAAPSTDAATAGPALWRIRDADSTIWVFGSVHALPPGVEWRRPAFDAALATADVVYFETALDAAAQMELQRIIFSSGMNEPGQTLSSQLSEEGAALLPEVARDLGLSPMMMEPMKPWLAFFAISAQAVINAGASIQAGVETVVEADARAAGTEIRYFETPEQQLRIFSDQPLEIQVELLESTLRQIDMVEAQYLLIVEAWLTADLEAFAEFEELMRTDMPPAVFQMVLPDRNRAWVEELSVWMEGSGTALVVVGAGHLVGQENVIELLAARGYSVERW